jgi:hypothetical protein
MREREGRGCKPSDKVAWVPPMCWFAAGQREVAIASKRSHARLQTQHCVVGGMYNLPLVGSVHDICTNV